MLDNVMLLTDSYKVTHYKQPPKDTKYFYSYFESRSGSVYPKTLFFGLQYYLKRYLTGQVVTPEKIDFAEKLLNTHLRGKFFNREGWEYIYKVHGGRLPVEIKAVPEGTIVGESNVLMTVENTDPKLYWLTNYLETLLVQVWYPSTVATQSYAMKKVLLQYLHETGDPLLIDFKLHDFGYRGVTCPEQAAIGAASHLVNFQGTDTIAGLELLGEYYDEFCAGFSIPASEHSTITSWGREHEVDACRNMLTQYPEGYVACVSDSYDIFNCCENIWGGVLKDEVLARDGVLVVRPDSGDPPTVDVRVLDILSKKFGFEYNSKGYKVLNPKVRVIQGDGIDYAMLGKILSAMKDAKFSADNIAFGSGGGLLQKLNRDTQRFAFKCSSVVVGDETRDVFKQPITDGGKKSKAGRFKLVNQNGEYVTVSQNDPRKDVLRTVFKDGELLVNYDLATIRSKVVN
jgi:nicotinamide phosphoribosyltransferase